MLSSDNNNDDNDTGHHEQGLVHVSRIPDNQTTHFFAVQNSPSQNLNMLQINAKTIYYYES